MTDQTPTPEQIAAIKWLRMMSSATSVIGGAHARVILDSLDPDLTNPEPALPTEPGLYLDPFGTVWHLHADIGLVRTVDSATNAHEFAPFTRLVPERPPITREQIENIVCNYSFATKPDPILIDALHAAFTNGVVR